MSSLEDLADCLELLLAPPGAESPIAVASKDFPQNCNRLLVLVPSPGATAGAWDTSVDQVRGSAVPLFRWAQANGYAACLFSAEALVEDPAGSWDRVLRGSPASQVSVIAATGALPTAAAALAPLHELLFARFRTLCAPFEGSDAQAWPPAWPAGLPSEFQEHLAAATTRAPAAWSSEEPSSVLQKLFELLQLRQERWQRGEARKYADFQGLKENDMPGLKRIGLEQRVQRLDRDRGDDELARLCNKNHKAGDSDEEPGVD